MKKVVYPSPLTQLPYHRTTSNEECVSLPIQAYSYYIPNVKLIHPFDFYIQVANMDSKTRALVEAWRGTLTEKERQLHELAAVKLKKTIVPKDMPDDKDNGSYYVEKCHAFKKWLAQQDKK